MAKIVQLHRMSSAQAGLYAGPQGEAIVDTGAYRMRVQDGVTPGGYATMLGSSNLSDLTAPATARTNLGLGTSAIKDTGTSGNTVALLDGVNTWSAAQTINGLLTTNGQVKFPAVQNPSGDPNTLDDYEEGTWTPSEGYAAFVWTFAAPRYTKIGNLIRIQTSFTTAGVQASAVQMRLAGLPFAANQTTGVAWGYSNGGENGSFYLAGGTTYIDIFKANGSIAQYQFFPGVTFFLNIMYETA